MPVRNIGLLPEIFRTNPNEKFINATIEQLTNEPNLKRVNGYVGKKFTNLNKSGDNYIEEITSNRNNYQLEPAIVVPDQDGNPTFTGNHSDLVNKIRYYGGNIDNQSRLFNNEYYSYDGQHDYDKFVNFSQYYWVPDGPVAVNIFSSTIPISDDILINRTGSSNTLAGGVGSYQFSSIGVQSNPILILARGGSYDFVAQQEGNPFWIQTEAGLSGVQEAQPNFSTREVFGVVNNGTDQGNITFNVPSANAQDFYTNMTSGPDVNFAVTGIAYSDIQGKLLSQFLALHGGIDGNDNIENKTLIFIDNDNDINNWTALDPYDNNLGFGTEFDDGETVPSANRTGIWQIHLEDDGNGDYIIHLTSEAFLTTNVKHTIIEGTQFNDRSFYKDGAGVILITPLITALQDTFYYQDGNDANLTGIIKLVEENESYIIDIEADILGQPNYTAPNSVVFTNGLKVKFDVFVSVAEFADKEYYVEGVGDAITLTAVDTFITPETYVTNTLEPFDTTNFDTAGWEGSLNAPTVKDYITINRASIDGNPWSRSNRWFHIDVLKQTGVYENFVAEIDQSARANRPIIEFDANLKLFNTGISAVDSVDAVDTTETDALSNIHGAPVGLIIDGVIIEEGMRILFINDLQENVRKTIYTVEYIDANNDTIEEINLVPDANQLEEGNNVLVRLGLVNQANMFYLQNGTLTLAQAKTRLNQQPLFDVFDKEGNKLSDTTTYINSSFLGTELFSYAVGTGSNDSILGFPLKYKNFNNVGDIVFENNFDSDQYSFTIDDITIASPINIGFLHKTTGLTTFDNINVWNTVANESNQKQLITYENNGTHSYLIDITPVPETTVKNYRVFLDHVDLDRDKFAFTNVNTQDFITIDESIDLTLVERIDILIYSSTESTLGWYQIPENLENNAQNGNFNELTLGQIRNHIDTSFNNANEVTGTFPGSSDLRDKSDALLSGGDILQHSASIPYANLFLLDDRSNFVDSVMNAQQEYARFKYKFTDLAIRLNIDVTDPVQATDDIITIINEVKTSSFPWFASDMVPYGADKTITTYDVVQTVNRDYELVTLFDNTKLSNIAALIYVNGVQLVNTIDFDYNTEFPRFTIKDEYPLAINDVITVAEYNNTDGNWIPETPSKLGLYPSFAPLKFNDPSFVGNPEVIRGHDGSITPAYGDFRDDLLLELEKRIFNNIKTTFDELRLSINAIKPGRFRETDYTLTEFNNTLARYFFKFVGENKLDYRNDDGFDPANGFTYNYRKFGDKIDNSPLPGSWKATYNYYYDTLRPNITPWEMLGFTARPSWWLAQYGPAPYTSGNLVLWDDLEAGIIRQGERAGIDPTYVRPGLLDIIPVDAYGQLLNPNEFLVNGTNVKYANEAYLAGEQGPVEMAWRNSSQFPYAMQIIIALLKPAKYFGLMADVQNYNFNTELKQFLHDTTNQRLTQNDIKLNGETVDGVTVRSAGYINWIVDYIKSDNVSPTSYLGNVLNDMTINLAYKVGGFTDKKLLKVIAEQSSPSSTTSSVVIPDEDFSIKLNKTAPLIRISYSSVIIEKTDIGFRVDGYNLANPHFTILPSIQNNNTGAIKVLNESIKTFKNYSNQPISIPYGFEFTDKISVIDFLLGYGRFLERQGFLFNEYDTALVEVKNWVMSSKEFLFWTQQGWNSGNVIVLNPLGHKVHLNTPGAVVGEIKQTTPNAITDQNFSPVPTQNFTVKRIDNEFELEVTDATPIGFLEFPLIQYEHILVFNNITVFNDIIYQAELGNRQIRLRLVGFVSNNWNGNLAPAGYIYNEDNVADWQQEKDYRRGDIVVYKSNHYVANENISGAITFDYDVWSIDDFENFNTGLIPNFSNLAGKPESFYEIDDINLEEQTDLFGKGLIGYRNRSYFNELGLDDTSQVKFYQGMIQKKGTQTSIDALTRARLKEDNSAIEIFEEWALRVGEYGAIDSTQLIEVRLDENEVTANPVLIAFNNSNDVPITGAINKYPKDIVQGPAQYDKNLFLTETNIKGLDYTIKTAGPPAINDVDYTLFSWDQFDELNAGIATQGVGQLIWVAKDLDNDWEIYRISNVEAVIKTVTVTDQTFKMDTNVFHRLEKGERIMIRNVASLLDGWYIVTEINDLNTFSVETTNDLTDWEDLTGQSGQLYKLTSNRFIDAQDLRQSINFDIRDGEKMFVDIADEDSNWAVIEKSSPWEFSERIRTKVLQPDISHGHSTEISADGLIVFGGAPGYNNNGGAVNISAKTQSGVYESLGVLQPKSPTTISFGKSISIDDGTHLVVGAPDSIALSGQVYIWEFDSSQSLTYGVKQIISVPNLISSSQFGSTVELSEDGNWLYIANKFTDTVAAYGLITAEEPVLEDWVTNTVSGTPTFGLSFTPPNRDALLIYDDAGKTYIDSVDYNVFGNTVVFTAPLALTSGDIHITFEVPDQYYLHVTDLPAPALDDSNSNYSITTNADGSCVVIGAPQTNSTGESYVYNRMVEAFIAEESQLVYEIDPGFDTDHIKVKIAGTELVKGINYNANTVNGTITLSAVPITGVLVEIETNTFAQIQTLAPTIGDEHANDLFGYSADMSAIGNEILVGMPNYDSGVATDSNNGIVYHYVNHAQHFGTIKSTVQNPVLTIGDSFRIDDLMIYFSGTTLTSVISDINFKNIPGVTATEDDGYLVITSDSRIDFDKLSVGPGRISNNNTGFTDLGFITYNLATTINSPLDLANEHFGESVALSDDGLTVVIGSSLSSSYITTTIDAETEETTFDGNSTIFAHLEQGSGSATVFEYLPVIGETLDNMGSYIFAQQLVGDGLSANDKFGFSVAVNDNLVIVGAPGDEFSDIPTGLVYSFLNDTKAKAWTTIRSREAKVDVDAINRIYLYNDNTKIITKVLDFIDPVKGKILGNAKHEIDFLTSSDPAKYNVSTDPDIANELFYWAESQIGRLWWDLSTIRYLDYEQDDVAYKFQNWGKIFPGSSIDVYEWVLSDVLPSQYVDEGYDGIPKDIDDSLYTAVSFINTQTNLTETRYYYWVQNRTEVDTIQSPHRTLSSTQIAAIIENPKGEGLPYAEILDASSIALINVTDSLTDDNIILHVDYDVIPNKDVIHAEYTLIQEGGDTNIPAKTLNKITDSLAGIDSRSLPVPNPDLPVSQRYGIDIRPRQSMFIDRPGAIEAMVLEVNRLFVDLRIVDLRTMPLMYSQEEIPTVTSGAYDEVVNTFDTLQLIDVNTKVDGYKVLVETDSTTNNFWVIYKLSNLEWTVNRVQSYDTNRYWNTIDWYAAGFSSATSIDITLQTRVELHTLQTLELGTIIKVLDNNNSQWELIQQTETGLVIVGVENSTVELSNKLYEPEFGAGYESLGYDLGQWDPSPQQETRNIVTSILTEILIDELSTERNRLFFVLIRHMLSEQHNVDWIFKTSFISAKQQFNRLEEFPIFQKDNQTYLEDYINEVKPYRTKIREYLLDYNKLETWEGDVTDFDVPGYYDFNLNRFRSPSGEQTEDTEILSTRADYNQWYNNYKYIVSSITVEDGGSGYNDEVPPAVTITGGGGTGATATSKSEFGIITGITVTNTGSGYTSTPTISFDTGAGTSARAYARLTNDTVRKLKMTMKFDRTTYDTTVLEWTPSTNYSKDDIITYNGNPFKAIQDFQTGVTFSVEFLAVVPAEEFTNANDRTWAYYQPGAGLVGRDLTQIFSGLEFPGVQIIGPRIESGFDSFGWDDEGFDFAPITAIDDTIDGGALTTNFEGLRPGEMDFDGGAFVDTYNSHAPEELLPGRVFDTLDLQVYSLVGADYENDGSNTRSNFRSHLADGTTTDFNYAIPERKDTDVIFVYTQFDGVKEEGIDYTVDYNNKIITFLIAPLNGDTVGLFVTDHIGRGTVYNEVFVGNGITMSWTIPLPITSIDTSFVTLNGVPEFSTLSATGAYTSIITLGSAPSIGTRIHLRALQHAAISSDPISLIHTETYTTTSALDTTIEVGQNVRITGPEAHKLVVEKDGVRLTPPSIEYWLGDGGRNEFTTAALITLSPAVVLDTNINVYIDGEKILFSQWSLVPYDAGIDTTNRRLNFGTAPAAGTEVAIELRTEAEYEYLLNGTQIELLPAAGIAGGEVIKVISWGNHDARRILTKVYDPVGSDIVLPFSIELPQGFDVGTFDDVSLDGPIVPPPAGMYTNPAYLWVTLNGIRLFPNINFSINPLTSNIDLLVPTVPGDILVITAFTENLQNPPIAYRMFQNIAGEVEYLRIAETYTARIAIDIAPTDTYITLDDISNMPIPDVSAIRPGVIFVNGERIIYYGMGATSGVIELGQTELNFNGITPNGSFIGGDGLIASPYAINDTITVDNGTIVTVDGVDGNGDVTAFTVTTLGTGLTSDVELLQTATSGTGVGFTLTPHKDFPNMPANTIWHLWRGTQGTSIPALHPAGDRVVDGSIQQRVPNTDNTRIDTLNEPWVIWNEVVNTNAELNALVFNAYRPGAKVLVMQPDAVANTQEVYVMEETAPGIFQWTLVQAYSDSVWYNPGVGTPSDGLGLQSSDSPQALFLIDGPAFVPDTT